MKLRMAVPRWLKAMRCAAPFARNDAGWRGDDERTGAIALRQAVVKSGDRRRTTNDLVGGVQDLEA